MDYENIVKAVEEGIKNTSENKVYCSDNFNFKCNDQLFFTIAYACNTAKSFSLVFWILKNLDKENMVVIKNNRDLMKRANLSPKTYYNIIKKLLENDFMVKLNSKKYMVNPDIVINYRKTYKANLNNVRALYKATKGIQHS